MRLDLTHLVMIKTVGGKHFLAPIDEDKVHRVLDVGTGTGICGASWGGVRVHDTS